MRYQQASSVNKKVPHKEDTRTTYVPNNRPHHRLIFLYKPKMSHRSGVAVALLCILAIVPTQAEVHPTLGQATLVKKLLVAGLGADPEASGTGGGTDCAGCTILISLFEQFLEANKLEVKEGLEEVCGLLPEALKLLCDAAVDVFGPALIPLVENKLNGDEVCAAIGICTNPMCHIFPNSNTTNARRYPPVDIAVLKSLPTYTGDWEPLRSIVQDIENVFNYHTPFLDFDNDNFTTEGVMRGSYWRGKDCDNVNGEIYPGRMTTKFRPNIDYNCNGIYGEDKDGNSLEEKLCGSTPQFGTAILGDSAAAHFHIPPQYFMPQVWSSAVFESILDIALNEFDWPQMSATTGYEQTDWMGRPRGPVASTYQKGVQRNRCAHRDYQNIGVNGARSSSMLTNIMYSFARDQQNDYPVILSYALIGNDVCNPHPGLSHMTTPEEFYQNVMGALVYLDTKLPAGSHVLFFGLADGLILYDTMHARIHPLGYQNQDVTYEDAYNFLNCLQISPCYGWLNSNETMRRLTQERAEELNAVYHKIIRDNSTSFQNFDLTYFPTPVREMIEIWEKQGGEAWELIEPVDGFHPNQLANFILAEYQWNLMVSNYSYLVPPVNPNNDKILELFGDQGGY